VIAVVRPITHWVGATDSLEQFRAGHGRVVWENGEMFDR